MSTEQWEPPKAKALQITDDLTSKVDPILQSHVRCAEYGLSHSENPSFESVSRIEMARVLDQNQKLYTHALPVIETLYQQILNTHNMVLLTDKRGLILHACGDPDFLEKADRVALRPGVDWSEQTKGTNAIGTALVEGEPTVVHADQHFLRANHFLTCSCAPIMDPQGSIVGALDVTGDHQSYHKHTMALVRMSAQMIENHLFLDAFPDTLRIHFHTRPEFIGTLVEGIAIFTAAGRFLSANRSGQFQLGMPLRALQAHTFSSLFGLSISALMDHFRMSNSGVLSCRMHNGVSAYLRAEFKFPKFLGISSPDLLGETDRTVVSPAPSAPPPPSNHHTLSYLRHLDTGDTQVSNVIAKIRKIVGSAIPILVLGETGTGKELLAQAIHNDSPRKEQPFIAINCASIPETLIESELFGYAEGAFTGGKKKGSIGKILMANGGTLFLDEIGDMPLNLQARLLRVLQERVVHPLGSDRGFPVNFALICATHRNLQEMISRGVFREDLYYRLNGLVVRLPPLRDRTDLEVIIRKVLQKEHDTGRTLIIDDEVLDMFKTYHWPGNFRQLTTLLRTASLMADEDGIITVAHLPDDFLEDYRRPSSATLTTVQEAVTRPGEASRLGNVAQGCAAQGSLQDVEFSTIEAALKEHGGNVSAAARALKISRNSIYRKIGSR